MTLRVIELILSSDLSSELEIAIASGVVEKELSNIVKDSMPDAWIKPFENENDIMHYQNILVNKDGIIRQQQQK